MPNTIQTRTVWVCVDCYEAHHGVGDDDSARANQREPLSLIGEVDEVTAGLMWDEHDDECANRLAREWVDECECERQTFSWSACQGCGSHLGGAREALTIWPASTDAPVGA